MAKPKTKRTPRAKCGWCGKPLNIWGRCPATCTGCDQHGSIVDGYCANCGTPTGNKGYK